ncbi:hypothetical protein [Nonlabens ponticola]|uniref:VWA domain-containing protein n=1 Tax=Nonlabens ponticola TaxID=2496866 RepID=A0A3S9MYS1_9FLAO|nr:hypothetical protein [Nonlabens ponticola]AZQ44406.1 hypothetical protein EJ995_09190 [Nonlabens ponticola]
MTYIWIILAAIVAVLIALFQYGFLVKSNKKKQPWFAVLRAITVFSILLLLLAPQFESTTYTDVKPQMAIVVDDSRSIEKLGASALIDQDLQVLMNDQEWLDDYDVSLYKMGDDITLADSLSFNQDQTDLDNAITKVQRLNASRNKAIVMMTDGNQTIGSSYKYTVLDKNTHLYSVVYGDTTSYADIKITQINVNKFSYLDNEFPVEILVSYSGEIPVNISLTINQDGKRLKSIPVSFDSNNRASVQSILLKSTDIGVQSYTASISTISQEKNTANNNRNFAVEVIDQQSQILILAEYLHPDLAALKKSIESNKFRRATIKTVDEPFVISEYDLVVKYGVGSAFAKAETAIKNLNKNTWTIVGPKPDLRYLNRSQEIFTAEVYAQKDEVQPVMNQNYQSFNLERFDLADFPPLQVPFGEVSAFGNIDVLFYKKIGAVETQQPLWFTYNEVDSKHAVTMGSGLWRWRSEAYLRDANFQEFDDLVSSQIQFLSSDDKRDRLEVDYERFYYENDRILLMATYLDENFEERDDAVLDLYIENKETGERSQRPFISRGIDYTVDLSGLAPGSYNFTTSVQSSNLRKSGSFKVLEFDIESQFVSANYKDLRSIATNGIVFTPDQISELKSTLKNDSLLSTIQREQTSFESLIDWRVLLIFILILLALEWILRKYNGLI